MNLELYYFESCPYCQKVLREIDRLDIKDKIMFKDTRKDKAHRDALIALNGKTQVPCLVIDGKPMLESDDIVKKLKTKFK